MSEKRMHNCTMFLVWMAANKNTTFRKQQRLLNSSCLWRCVSPQAPWKIIYLSTLYVNMSMSLHCYCMLDGYLALSHCLCAQASLWWQHSKNTWSGTMTETKILVAIIACNVLCNWMHAIVRCTSIGIVQSQSNNNDSSDHKSIFASFFLSRSTFFSCFLFMFNSWKTTQRYFCIEQCLRVQKDHNYAWNASKMIRSMSIWSIDKRIFRCIQVSLLSYLFVFSKCKLGLSMSPFECSSPERIKKNNASLCLYLAKHDKKKTNKEITSKAHLLHSMAAM